MSSVASVSSISAPTAGSWENVSIPALYIPCCNRSWEDLFPVGAYPYSNVNVLQSSDRKIGREVLLLRRISWPSCSTAMTTPCRCMPSAEFQSCLFSSEHRYSDTCIFAYSGETWVAWTRTSCWMSSVFFRRPNDCKPSSSARVLLLDQPSVAMPRSQPVSMKPVVVLPPRRSCQLSQHFWMANHGGIDYSRPRLSRTTELDNWRSRHLGYF